MENENFSFALDSRSAKTSATFYGVKSEIRCGVRDCGVIEDVIAFFNILHQTTLIEMLNF